MTTTGPITLPRHRALIPLGEAISRWARRRAVRESLSDLYFGPDGGRRLELEARLLLDRERRAAQRELERTAALSRMYAGR